jgi:hypothetical protein
VFSFRDERNGPAIQPGHFAFCFVNRAQVMSFREVKQSGTTRACPERLTAKAEGVEWEPASPALTGRSVALHKLNVQRNGHFLADQDATRLKCRIPG